MHNHRTLKSMRSLERTLARHAIMALSAGDVEFAIRRMENLDSVRKLRQTTEKLDTLLVNLKAMARA